MRIEAITVCVGYGDFLAVTLPENQHLVDDLVVITSPDDDETREVCRKYSVHHVLSEDHRRGGPFNKARLVNRALDQINAREWVLHIDADIVLPRQFAMLLDVAHIDEKCIYGADRCSLTGYDQWVKFKREKGGWDNHRYDNYLTFPPDSAPGARWVSKLHGYVPIGAFQLFHGDAAIDRGIHQKRYPHHHGDAARADVQFALQWDRRYRRLLPEVAVLHLESQKAKLGANWCGRTTTRFGPEIARPPQIRGVS